MADSGYYVGDKATGSPFEELLVGGGATITQQIETGVVQFDSITVTHPEDILGTRVVQVTKFVVDKYVLTTPGVEYDVFNVNDTQTRIVKKDTGSDNIKINVLT